MQLQHLIFFNTSSCTIYNSLTIAYNIYTTLSSIRKTLEPPFLRLILRPEVSSVSISSRWLLLFMSLPFSCLCNPSLDLSPTLLRLGTGQNGWDIVSRHGCWLPVTTLPIPEGLRAFESAKSPESKNVLFYSRFGGQLDPYSVAIERARCRNIIPPADGQEDLLDLAKFRISFGDAPCYYAS